MDRRREVEREKDSILVALGERLESEREAQSLTVAEMARRAGLSKRGVIYSRKTQSDPKLSTLLAQCRALGLRFIVTVEPDGGQQ